MAVTKKKLAESRDRMRGHQNTCQCFEVSASFDHLSMSPRLVTRLCISASGGSCLPSAFSSILKMLALIVATEIQLFLNENHVRFTRRVHEAGVNIATRHLALSLNEQVFADVTHQSKWRDLRTLMEKVFNFFY